MRRTGTLFLALGLAACSGGPAPRGDSSVGAAVSGVQVESVRYALAWDRSGAEPLADGGWSFTREDGVQIFVRSGGLTTLGASLAPCATAQAEPRLLPSLLQWALPRPARAGHGEDLDASAVASTWIEDLSAPGELALGAGVGGAHAYCRAHTAMGPAGPALESRPEMAGLSFRLAGEVRAEGQVRAFDISTSAAHGHLAELPADAGARLEVRFVRSLRVLAEALDPDLLAVEPEASAWAALDAVSRGMTVSIAPEGGRPDAAPGR